MLQPGPGSGDDSGDDSGVKTSRRPLASKAKRRVVESLCMEFEHQDGQHGADGVDDDSLQRRTPATDPEGRTVRNMGQ